MSSSWVINKNNLHQHRSRNAQFYEFLRSVYGTRIFTWPYSKCSIYSTSAWTQASARHSTFLPCCVSSENLSQFNFGEFSYHPLETNTACILNGPMTRNPVVRVEARQLAYFYPLTRKLSIHVPAGNELILVVVVITCMSCWFTLNFNSIDSRNLTNFIRCLD
jgi:hypothetical protein